MRTIYKYELTMGNMCVTAHIEKLLRVDFQNGLPMLWAVVNDKLPLKTIEVLICPTGIYTREDDDIPIDNYLNTTVMSSEPYVWHAFWREVEREGVS